MLKLRNPTFQRIAFQLTSSSLWIGFTPNEGLIAPFHETFIAIQLVSLTCAKEEVLAFTLHTLGYTLDTSNQTLFLQAVYADNQLDFDISQMVHNGTISLQTFNGFSFSDTFRKRGDYRFSHGNAHWMSHRSELLEECAFKCKPEISKYHLTSIGSTCQVSVWPDTEWYSQGTTSPENKYPNGSSHPEEDTDGNGDGQ